MPREDIIEAALTDRIRTCVLYGQCVCEFGDINDACPCHGATNIALNAEEAEIVDRVIESERARELEEESNSEEAGS